MTKVERERIYKLEDANPDDCWCSSHKKLCPKKGRCKGDNRWGLWHSCAKGSKESNHKFYNSESRKEWQKEYGAKQSTLTAQTKRRKDRKAAHPYYSAFYQRIIHCYNKTHKSYEYYGYRGILIEDYFLEGIEMWFDKEGKFHIKGVLHSIGYARFVGYLNNVLGPKPKGYTLDRIDNDKGYIRGNMRWASKKEQTLNQRKHITNHKYDKDIAAMQAKIDALEAQITNN